MSDLDEFVSKFKYSDNSIPENKTLDVISKMVVADSTVKNQTTPNAMVTGGLPVMGFQRVSANQMLKILLCHPAVEQIGRASCRERV